MRYDGKVTCPGPDAATGPPASVRTALVGYGLGGSLFHAPFIAADPRFDLVAVVTADPGRRAAAAGRHPGVRLLDRFSDVLDIAGEIDLVVVSTPNASHLPLVEAALAAGAHVVVDKPVAPTAGEVGRLIAAAAAAGRMLVPFHNRRWDGDYRTVRSLLADGRLGRLHRFESRYERWQPEVPDGPERSWKRQGGPGAATGILYDLGTHLVDQCVAAFGRPASVYAEIDVRRRGAAVDDDVFLALRYGDGLVAHLWAGALAADRGPRFRLLGSEGAYVKYGMDTQEADLAAGVPPGAPGWGAEPDSLRGTLTTAGGAEPLAGRPGAYQLFWTGLAACLLDGAPPPVEASDALVTAAIVDAARRSAADGSVVRLDHPDRQPSGPEPPPGAGVPDR